MTTDEIQRDRETCARATEGPWEWNDSDQLDSPNRWPHIIETDNGVYPPNENDRRFIAAARTRWPAALDEIERLRNRLGTDHSGRCSMINADVPCDCGWDDPANPINYTESLEAERDQLRAEVEQFKAQHAGMTNAPTEWIDTLTARASGRCLGTIGKTMIACGEGGNHCSAACQLRAALIEACEIADQQDGRDETVARLAALRKLATP